ncbi:hypothetical protein BH11BAC6_BH11BAC6_00730 [soil metagenome]
MKNFKVFFTVILLSCMQFIAHAQDKVVTTTHTETHTWYAEPWVWVVGGIALVILLALLFSKRDRTTITNTTVE